ncbi:MAG TPA: acetamidase/formamidase family protein [Bacillota bacterium]|nr:acetamidase/formamidase family protein [Bacillota bacterium]
MQTIKDSYIYSFDRKNKPIARVQLGEVFAVKTLDCYGGVITSENQLRSDFPDLKINGATGPIYVEGVEKGDTLAVEILKIDLDDQGVMITQPGGGLLGDQITESETRILPVYDDYALLADRVQIPLNKMIGVIGVAPAEKPVSSVSPGSHGGNLDTKEITEGNTVYFPVGTDGALLALGDMHAAMGDGELNGTGIEIGGTAILRVKKKPDVSITSPIVETNTQTMFLYSDEDFHEAVKGSMGIAVDWLQKKHDLKYSDAYRLLTAVGDIKVSQLVNPKVTVRVAIPKTIFQL